MKKCFEKFVSRFGKYCPAKAAIIWKKFWTCLHLALISMGKYRMADISVNPVYISLFLHDFKNRALFGKVLGKIWAILRVHLNWENGTYLMTDMKWDDRLFVTNVYMYSNLFVWKPLTFIQLGFEISLGLDFSIQKGFVLTWYKSGVLNLVAVCGNFYYKTKICLCVPLNLRPVWDPKQTTAEITQSARYFGADNVF